MQSAQNYSGQWAQLSVLAVALLLSAPVWSHGGEDHGDEKKPAVSLPAPGTAAPGGWAATVESAQRLADGALFVPKAMQRQLGVRTVPAEGGTFARSIELNAHVVADPNAGGKVQSVQSGRIEAGEQGIALPGQAVNKGAVLAWLAPVADSLARSGQQAALAEAEAQWRLAEKRRDRLAQLEGSVPQKEIETARIEAGALAARHAALAAGLAREALRAPVDGIVSAVHVSVGQIVDARETLFEVIDPRRLAIEAQSFEPLPAAGLAEGSVLIGGRSIALDYLGAGRSLREMALPVMFRLRAGQEPPVLAVGQPLKVLAQTRERLAGVAVPAVAVTRGANNETVVWVHDAAERFVPHRVRATPIDAARMRIDEGLKPGERVVVDGAAALAQIR